MNRATVNCNGLVRSFVCRNSLTKTRSCSISVNSKPIKSIQLKTICSSTSEIARSRPISINNKMMKSFQLKTKCPAPQRPRFGENWNPREVLLQELHRVSEAPRPMSIALIKTFMKCMGPVWARGKNRGEYFKASDTFELLDCVMISECLYAPRDQAEQRLIHHTTDLIRRASLLSSGA